MRLSFFYIANSSYRVLRAESIGFDNGITPIKIQPVYYDIELLNGEYQHYPIEEILAIDLFIKYSGCEYIVNKRLLLGEIIRSLIECDENCYRLVFDFISLLCICYFENKKKISIKAKEKFLIERSLFYNANNAFSKNVFLEKDKLKLKESDNIWFKNCIKQFTYRYIIYRESKEYCDTLFKKKHNDIILLKNECIEETLYDYTYDKLHDGGLFKYHQAGKPKKLAIKWHIGKSEYSAYFWFEDERIREVFDKFYGVHPDTKTDFIIRIDAENKKYELALYRYGLKEPQIIPEDVYQLLVFKNKFEDYRSDNYNQERGALIW